ncbi:MAG: hypothetical protein ACKN9T_07295 [Candidatus Methylumidiphilus sp.]
MKELQDAKEILQVIFSWPAVAVIFVLVLRLPIVKLINRLVSSETGKLEIGPFKTELGKLTEQGHEAVNRLNQINHIMAESRLLELEITEATFGSVFTPEQRERMKKQIEQLKSLTTQNTP